jgi:hypothetical protein
MNKLMTNLLGTFLVLTNPAALAKRRESGQGSLEYVAMFAVAAIIIIAVISVAKTSRPAIQEFISKAISDIKSNLGG